MERTIIYAHRGASGYMPENTLSSFRRGIELGADGIELDVHLSKDGELIVCHDEKVDRTTNGKGYIKDLTLNQLKQLDAGSWFGEEFRGEQIPTLEEVFEHFKEDDICYNIELKNAPIIYPNIEKMLVELIEKYHLVDAMIISSFNHYSLVEIKKLNPELKTGALYMAGFVQPWKYAKETGIDALHPFVYNILGMPSLVQESIENGIKVNAFTVNEEAHIAMVLQTGITGIISDYPDRVKKAIMSSC